jgi:hypothetical protein
MKECNEQFSRRMRCVSDNFIFKIISKLSFQSIFDIMNGVFCCNLKGDPELIQSREAKVTRMLIRTTSTVKLQACQFCQCSALRLLGPYLSINLV